MTDRPIGTARNNNSRAEEFDMIFGFLKEPSVLVRRNHQKIPEETTSDVEDIEIECGNISRLAIALDRSTPTSPFKSIPKYIGLIRHAVTS